MQKGLPILAIPLIIKIFGVSAYAEFILFYTLVQVYANFSSLAVPQVLISLWFRSSNRNELSTAIIALVVVLSVLFALPVILVLQLIGYFPGVSLSSLEFCSWIFAFSLVLNLNSIAVSLIRVRDRQRWFFFATLFGALFYLSLLLGLSNSKAPSLSSLVMVQMLGLMVTLLVMSFNERRAIIFLPFSRLLPQWRPILSQSMPLCIYTCITLYASSVDKWVIKYWFDVDFFNQYVLNAQLAYSIMLISTAFSLQAAPTVSRLVSAHDYEGLRAYESKMARLIAFGSILMAIAVAIYASLTGIHISWGYLWLVIGYIFEGQYNLKSMRLMAELQSLKIVLAVMVSSLALTVMLCLVALLGIMTAVYWCVPLGQLVAFSLARRALLRLR